MEPNRIKGKRRRRRRRTMTDWVFRQNIFFRCYDKETKCRRERERERERRCRVTVEGKAQEREEKIMQCMIIHELVKC